MRSITKSFTPTILTILGYLAFAPPSSYAIDNKQQWDAAFESSYRNSDPMLDITNGNDTGMFAWQAHYWVRAYVSMAQASGESRYLDKAVKLIDHMIFFRDDARQRRGEIDVRREPYGVAPSYYIRNRNKAAPVWRRRDPAEGWRIFLVEDGQITHAIMRFVELVYSDLRFAAYRSKASEYVAKVEETVKAHDETFVFHRTPDLPGSYYYPNRRGDLYSGGVEFNMNATMGVTLLLINKVKGGRLAYRRKAEAILEYFKKHVRIIHNEAYDWNYHLVRPDVHGSAGVSNEDFAHGHLDVSFLVAAYRQKLALKRADMQRLSNTLTKNVYRGNGELAWSVDGRGRAPLHDAHAVAFDWIELAEFDRRVLEIATEFYKKHYRVPTWARPFLGWAEILRWIQLHREKKEGEAKRS